MTSIRTEDLPIAPGRRPSYATPLYNRTATHILPPQDLEIDRGDADSHEARAQARARLMLGQWAAEQMGLKDAAAYAQAVARHGAGSPLEEDVLRKVGHDLSASGLAVGAAEVGARFAEFLAQSRAMRD